MYLNQHIEPDVISTACPRVAIVAPDLGILGGQGVQALSLLERLRTDQVDVTFIAINRSFPPGLAWIKRLPVARTIINELLYVPALMRLKGCDVVHVFSASYWSFLLAPVPAILLARLFGKRVILNYHSGEADDHLSSWGVLLYPFLSLVDQIVVPSEYLQRVFRKFGYEATVVRNIVDVVSFKFRPRAKITPRLLSIRNLAELYRVDNTILAFEIVKRNFPEASLVIAGYGAEESRLRELVATRGIAGVEFRGRVAPEEMPLLFDGADIFLNSSVIDNQPLSILEAFAAGLIVISTPVGDIPAMMKGGEAGQLVPCNDPQAMAAAIEATLNNQQLAQAMIAAARKEVLRYTWPKVRGAWLDVYSGNKQ